MKYKVSFILLILISINTVVYSMNKDPTFDFSSIERISENLKQNYEYFPDISLKSLIENYKSNGSLKITFKEMIINIAKFSIKEIILNYKLLLEILAIGIISAIIHTLQNAFEDNNIAKLSSYAIFLIVTIIIIRTFTYAIAVANRAIDDMVNFMNALIPALITMLIGTGSIATATTLDPILMFFIKFSSDVIKNIILPITIIAVVVFLIDNLSDDIKISKLGEFINTINQWLLGFIMTIFIGIITVRGITANTFDEVAIKSTKFAVDKFIPIVGGALSDAVTTVASYSLILKDAVSIFGLFIIIGICIFPLIKIIVLSLIYRFACVILEPIVDDKIVKPLSVSGKTMLIIFASVLSVAVMFFIMITILASAGKVIVNVG
ncbi:Stage III sporulation protein AE precursor [Caloramator mitchellensis]|uniref:Stage III sporulation protein AE n=1 Tax=Caloramator mitchellensis TaxID=908809 RepID=A0A0R3JTI1_CALMK|nr:stage III sporulation protein AE [Caloramator mitchellensis]KRQ86839.1 Stage III sporulation protein AE precursor [Caloramator mitchellensis]